MSVSQYAARAVIVYVVIGVVIARALGRKCRREGLEIYESIAVLFWPQCALAFVRGCWQGYAEHRRQERQLQRGRW